MSVESSSIPPEGVLSPTGTGVTPLPVIANWFTQSDLEKQTAKVQEKISKFINPTYKEEAKQAYSSSDDIDNRSVNSDNTVIENKQEVANTFTNSNHFNSNKQQSQQETVQELKISSSLDYPSRQGKSSPQKDTSRINKNYTESRQSSSNAKASISATKFTKQCTPALNSSQSTSNVLDESQTSLTESILKTSPVKCPEVPTPIRKHSNLIGENVSEKDQSTLPYDPSMDDIISNITFTQTSTENRLISEANTVTKADDAINTDEHVTQSAPPPPPPPAQIEDCRSVPLPSTATGQFENPCIITVPQSPSEIRKKFQQQASFEKSFQKSADFELSEEFRAGVKGKVRESKESFLKKSNSDKLLAAKEKREIELEALKLHRSDSRNFDEPIVDKSEVIRQEKMRELEDVKRSRTRQKMQDEATEEEESAAMCQDKLDRQSELASLSNRKLDIEDAFLFSPTELREIQLREERERELQNLSRRHVAEESVTISTQREWEARAERNRELQALADRSLDIDRNTPSRAEILRQERSEELREIARLRSGSFSNSADVTEEETDRPGSEVEDDDVRGRVRGTKAMWQQREQSGSREGRSACATPTRRIGSMFNRDPEYWGDVEDLPAPPSELVNPVYPESDNNPPPPPRESSKGKVEEYRHWTNNWGSAVPPNQQKIH